MSFGLLKRFKETKTSAFQGKPSAYYQHLILGQDLGAILKLTELLRTHPGESVRLITTRPLTRQGLLENYEFGVSHLRSPLAVEGIYRRYFNARILPQSKEAAFYKDGKFHDFGGRAKSMDLRSGEDFFVPKGYRVDIASLFHPEDWDNLDSLLTAHTQMRIFEGIEKTVPQDFVEKKEWALAFKDFGLSTCENLYVAFSPKRFLGLVHQKDALTPELIDLCSGVHVQAAISVSWKLDREIFPEDRTLFIPQSMTHEWGHFLVEFTPYNPENQEQVCHVLFLIQEEEPQSEDLAGKIKLLKRVLDRVFPDLEKSIKKEYIRFDEEMFISGVKDAAAEQLAFDFPTLKFLGQATPMIASLAQEKYLSRVLLS